MYVRFYFVKIPSLNNEIFRRGLPSRDFLDIFYLLLNFGSNIEGYRRQFEK